MGYAWRPSVRRVIENGTWRLSNSSSEAGMRTKLFAATPVLHLLIDLRSDRKSVRRKDGQRRLPVKKTKERTGKTASHYVTFTLTVLVNSWLHRAVDVLLNENSGLKMSPII